MQDRTSSASLENAIALQKYGVGQPVRRKEDDTLVRGKGKYTDDFSLPGQAYAWIVRSSHAHGIIRGIDTRAAKAMPGVLGVWTGTDLAAAGYGPFTCGLPLKSRDGSPLLQTNRTALMTDKVRYVGDPVAFVVAVTLAQAREAGEAIELDIEPLPAVTDAAEAARPGAPQLYDHIPNNVALDYHYGDAAKIDAAFAGAAHVTKLDIVNTRVAVVSMEPRVALAAYDRTSERYTLQVPTQGVSGNKVTLAKILNVPNDKVRILTANVGGSFGMKNVSYPEYICILHAAKILGRPVKWTDERSTSFLSDSQGRAQLMHAELALDADGKFLAVRLQGYGNLGAYITGVAPGPLSLNTGKNLASVYRTPLLGVDIKTVLTNTTLMGAYRGAGRPEANYYMERLIDRAASEMGINPLTLRKRNFIKPAQMPFAAASGVTYDSGDFQGVFNKALEISDHANFAKRKKASRKEGKLRGIAVGSYLEVTAPPSGELGKITFEPDGSVKLTTGTLDYGQGHATPFAQVLSAQLGVPFERIELDILKGETRTPEFLQKNPNGRIPVLEIEDGVFLAESNAILWYVAGGTPLAPESRIERAEALQWMFFEQHALEPNIGAAYFWLALVKGGRDLQTHALEDWMERGYAALQVMENHLKTHEYFAAGQLTVADIAMYGYTHVADRCDFDLATFPAIRTWLRRVEQTQGFVPMDWQPGAADSEVDAPGIAAEA